MNKQTKTLQHMYEKIDNAFNNDEVRPDHFDGNNGLYRLAADIWYDYGYPDNVVRYLTEKDVDDIRELLCSLSIPPYVIFINRTHIQVEWSPNGLLILNSREDYKQLVLEFINYIDRLNGLNSIAVNFSIGMFQDDPIADDEDVKDINKINSAKFSAENFGNEEDVRIYRL